MNSASSLIKLIILFNNGFFCGKTAFLFLSLSSFTKCLPNLFCCISKEVIVNNTFSAEMSELAADHYQIVSLIFAKEICFNLGKDMFFTQCTYAYIY